jgi:hypothetical protein
LAGGSALATTCPIRAAGDSATIEAKLRRRIQGAVPGAECDDLSIPWTRKGE